MRAVSMLAALCFLVTESSAYLAANSTTDSVSETNSSLVLTWSSEDSRGIFQDGLATLYETNSTTNGVRVGNSSFGVLVQFNETIAAGQNATQVPFFALISCDRNDTLPFGDASMNTTISSNGTTSSNDTMSGSANATSTSVNGTSNATSIDVFQLAASLNASGAILYSTEAQSCQLYSEYLSNSSIAKPLSIWSTKSESAAKILLAQFGNIPANGTYFNATALDESADRVLQSFRRQNVESGFLLANVTVSVNETDSGGPVYGSISAVPSATGTSQSIPVITGAAPSSSPSSGRPNSSPRLDKNLVSILLTVLMGVIFV